MGKLIETFFSVYNTNFSGEYKRGKSKNNDRSNENEEAE